jgi:hypothetical protein
VNLVPSTPVLLCRFHQLKRYADRRGFAAPQLNVLEAVRDGTRISSREVRSTSRE